MESKNIWAIDFGLQKERAREREREDHVAFMGTHHRFQGLTSEGLWLESVCDAFKADFFFSCVVKFLTLSKISQRAKHASAKLSDP